MKDRDSALQRLLRSAAQVPEEKITGAPFGFETRVVARWRAGRAFCRRDAGSTFECVAATLLAIDVRRLDKIESKRSAAQAIRTRFQTGLHRILSYV